MNKMGSGLILRMMAQSMKKQVFLTVKEMGGQVSRFEGLSEVEMSKNFKDYEIKFK